MKAIVGIVRFDSQDVDRATMGGMMACIQQADPRSAVIWHGGPVALGTIYRQCRPDNTSATSSDNQYTASMPFHNLRLVFDGRIDNRKELLQKVGVETNAALTDDELILVCYGKWGEDTPAHLVGDYAFAIWDERTHTLFCARDHFGLRPLYTYICPKFFLFSSDLGAILAHPEVPRRINDLRVALHLSVQAPDNRLTFYQEIERLPPAHSLKVTDTGATVQKQYWSIDNISELRLPSDTEYADAFRQIFTEAVACRIPQVGPIGTLLSGGLDSTSVISVLQKLIGPGSDGVPRGMLHTFSAVFDKTPECDERHYIDVTLQMGGIIPHFVDVESSSPLTKIDQMLTAMGEPFPSPTLYIVWGLYQEASKHGIQVVFDGMDGDTAVHHGDAYLAELARTSQWPDFFTLAKAIAERKKLSLPNSLMHYYGEPYLRSLASSWRWHKLHQELRALSPYTTMSTRRLFYNYVRDYSLRPLSAKARTRTARLLGVRIKEGQPNTGVMSQTLLRQTDLLDHIGARLHATQPPATSRQEHYQQLTTPLLPQIFEISMRAAQAFGIEVRQPFTDRRLVEFCYALPPQQKVADGWTRNILRRGLAGIIPEAIRQRGDKAVNSRAVTKALLGQDVRYLENLVYHDAERLERFIDVPLLQAAYERYRSTENKQDEMLIWQSATLALWLQQTEAMPQMS